MGHGNHLRQHLEQQLLKQKIHRNLLLVQKFIIILVLVMLVVVIQHTVQLNKIYRWLI